MWSGVYWLSSFRRNVSTESNLTNKCLRFTSIPSMGLLYFPLFTYIWLICIVFTMVPGKCREKYTMDGMGSCRLRLTCEPILKVVAMPSVPCEQKYGLFEDQGKTGLVWIFR